MSQLKGSQAGGVLSDLQEHHLFILFRSSSDWMRAIHIREGNLLYPDSWFKFSYHPKNSITDTTSMSDQIFRHLLALASWHTVIALQELYCSRSFRRWLLALLRWAEAGLWLGAESCGLAWAWGSCREPHSHGFIQVMPTGVFKGASLEWNHRGHTKMQIPGCQTCVTWVCVGWNLF